MFSLRLEKLQKKIASQQMDAFLITNMENIRYITGFTGTSALTLVGPDKALFLTDSRYTTQANQQVKYCEIREYKKQMEELMALIKAMGIKRLAFEATVLPFVVYAKLKDSLENVDLIGVENWVEEQRMVKDQTEIEALRHTIAITQRGYDMVRPRLVDGAVEHEIAVELEYEMRKAGAEQIAFDTIVASGIRGSMPHGIASTKVIKEGEMVTIDFGARCQGYCSDCTRTVSLGKVPAKQAEIYRIVYEANQAATAEIKPGKKAKEIDAIGRDLIKAAGYGEFFGHGTGHGVGLAVHEDPRISWEGEVILEPGIVFTIEPGIYIPGLGGARIEDMILVTEKGYEVLTSNIEKQQPLI